MEKGWVVMVMAKVELEVVVSWLQMLVTEEGGGKEGERGGGMSQYYGLQPGEGSSTEKL